MLPACGQRKRPHPREQQRTDPNLPPGSKEEAVALDTEGDCYTLEGSHSGEPPRLSTQ